VISRGTPRFWAAYRALPQQVRQQARLAYRRFQANPSHPGLRFRKVHETEPIYSARISRDVRTLGLVEGETVVWFWIGSHAEYDRLLEQL
jgi:hypothetical protein